VPFYRSDICRMPPKKVWGASRMQYGPRRSAPSTRAKRASMGRVRPECSMAQGAPRRRRERSERVWGACVPHAVWPKALRAVDASASERELPQSAPHRRKYSPEAWGLRGMLARLGTGAPYSLAAQNKVKHCNDAREWRAQPDGDERRRYA